MLSGRHGNLSNFGFCDFPCKNAAYGTAVMMNMQHNRDGIRLWFVKDGIKNLYDKIHWRIIIVQQDNPVCRWQMEFVLFQPFYIGIQLIRFLWKRRGVGGEGGWIFYDHWFVTGFNPVFLKKWNNNIFIFCWMGKENSRQTLFAYYIITLHRLVLYCSFYEDNILSWTQHGF